MTLGLVDWNDVFQSSKKAKVEHTMNGRKRRSMAKVHVGLEDNNNNNNNNNNKDTKKDHQ